MLVEIDIQEAKELSKCCRVYNGYSFIVGAEKANWWDFNCSIKFYKVIENGILISLIAGYEYGEDSFYICELGKIHEEFPITKLTFDIVKNMYRFIYFQAANSQLLDYYVRLGASEIRDNKLRY